MQRWMRVKLGLNLNLLRPKDVKLSLPKKGKIKRKGIRKSFKQRKDKES